MKGPAVRDMTRLQLIDRATLAGELYDALNKYKAYRTSGEAGSSSQCARQMRAEMNDAIDAVLAKASVVFETQNEIPPSEV